MRREPDHWAECLLTWTLDPIEGWVLYRCDDHGWFRWETR